MLAEDNRDCGPFLQFFLKLFVAGHPLQREEQRQRPSGLTDAFLSLDRRSALLLLSS